MPEQARGARVTAEVLLSNAGAGVPHSLQSEQQRLTMAVQGVGYAILALADVLGRTAPRSAEPPPPGASRERLP
jgi:hypothetical protein